MSFYDLRSPILSLLLFLCRTGAGVVSGEAEGKEDDEICTESPANEIDVVLLNGAEAVQWMIDVTVLAPDTTPSG